MTEYLDRNIFSLFVIYSLLRRTKGLCLPCHRRFEIMRRMSRNVLSIWLATVVCGPTLIARDKRMCVDMLSFQLSNLLLSGIYWLHQCPVILLSNYKFIYENYEQVITSSCWIILIPSSITSVRYSDCHTDCWTKSNLTSKRWKIVITATVRKCPEVQNEL